jgi:predicted component of type VI protein secretion system
MTSGAAGSSAQPEAVHDRQIDLLYVSPEAFRRSPQVGVPCRMPWSSLVAYLSRPSFADGKADAGGYALGRYREDIRRKANLISTESVVFDFDESAVPDVAAALALYAATVHETFSSADDGPRCRALVLLAEPIDAPVYERLHAVMRERFRAASLPPDEGAKDASRLSYSPVRRHGARFAFAKTSGRPLDARAVLAAQPPPASRSTTRAPEPEHGDRYLAGALRRASDAVASATPGERHYALSREAFALARLGISDQQIHAVLTAAFTHAAGEARQREGERTIADAIRARRGAA